MDPTSRLTPALAAYTQAVERMRASAGPVAGEPAPVQSFAALLADNLTAAVEAGQRSETAARQAAVGAADLQDLVAAVNAAELSLQSVVAVRDRIIGAYQDILRMPI
jgi:flagellar hook-basal body complex protein FliE